MKQRPHRCLCCKLLRRHQEARKSRLAEVQPQISSMKAKPWLIERRRGLQLWQRFSFIKKWTEEVRLFKNEPTPHYSGKNACNFLNVLYVFGEKCQNTELFRFKDRALFSDPKFESETKICTGLSLQTRAGNILTA